MSVRVTMASYPGGAGQPEIYDDTSHVNVAAAVAAVAGGFLTITRNAPDPAGGTGDVETIALSVSQVKSIVQL